MRLNSIMTLMLTVVVLSCSQQSSESPIGPTPITGELNYGTSTQVAVLGTAVTISPVSKDPSVAGCSLASGALPAGLNVNASTCNIEGTATVATEEETVSIAYSVSGGAPKTTTLKIKADECPNNFVPVPNGASTFCVAKYEMRNVNNTATSQASGLPWTSISQTGAKTACANLGSNYHLITNNEWMVIAKDIENVNTNWTNNSIGGVNKLISGHSDNDPEAVLCDSSTPSVKGSCSALDNDPIQRRTFNLSNGQVVWDFSGNAAEWVDLNVPTGNPGGKAFDADFPIINSTNADVWREWKNIDSNLGIMTPATWQSQNPTLDHATNNIGSYFAGVNTTGGAALRGGASTEPESAGVYSLSLYLSGSESFIPIIGFRCVYSSDP